MPSETSTCRAQRKPSDVFRILFVIPRLLGMLSTAMDVFLNALV